MTPRLLAGIGLRSRLCLALVALGAAFHSSTALAQAPAPTRDTLVAIRAGALVDVRGGRLLPNPLVVVRAGRIVSVTRNGRVPEGARLIDLDSLTLLPGLID